MRRVLPLLIVLCLGFAPAPVSRGEPDTSKGDLEKMQGKWLVVRQAVNGKDQKPAGNYVIEIAGDRFRHHIGGKMLLESSVKLDATKSVKQIDRHPVNATGAGAETPLLGIYRLDGDSLRIAYIRGGKLRPSDFDGKGRGEADCVASVLNRIKP